MARLIRLISLILIPLLTACSGEAPESGKHVWQEQTDTIKRAEQVEAAIMEAAEQQREIIEEQE